MWTIEYAHKISAFLLRAANWPGLKDLYSVSEPCSGGGRKAFSSA